MPYTAFVHVHSYLKHSHLIPKMNNLNFIIFNIFINFYRVNDLDGYMNILSTFVSGPSRSAKEVIRSLGI